MKKFLNKILTRLRLIAGDNDDDDDDDDRYTFIHMKEWERERRLE